MHLGDDLVQVGTAAAHSVVFSRLAQDDLAWLEDLVAGVARPAVRDIDVETATGIRRMRMLADLERAGLIEAAPALDARVIRVRIVGLNGVGVALARLLADSGIGSLDLRDSRLVTPVVEPHFPVHAKGMLRKDALEVELARAGLTLGRLMVPHLVVTTHDRVIHDALPGTLLSQDLPHLPIVSDDREVVVGPLVLPGLTPCTFCLDWHRGDHIPHWAKLKEQLQALPPLAESVHLAQIAAGLAGTLFLTLANPPDAADAARLEGPEWYSGVAWRVTPHGVTRQRWHPHPHCACHIRS